MPIPWIANGIAALGIGVVKKTVTGKIKRKFLTP